jgi:hypothetical protein
MIQATGANGETQLRPDALAASLVVPFVTRSRATLNHPVNAHSNRLIAVTSRQHLFTQLYDYIGDEYGLAC